MIIETLSTFPHMYDSVMGTSMMRIAQKKGILDFHAYDLRDWTHDRHRTTDDDPYGGGAGLVMKCEPLFEAYDDICARAVGAAAPASAATPADAAPTEDAAAGELGLASAESAAVCQPKPHVIFLAPQGRRFDDACALELAKEERLLFVCGHYEGIDERAYTLADEVVSLGDYVLTSGELASMVVIDAVVRKLPGVLGAEEGAKTARIPPVHAPGDLPRHGGAGRPPVGRPWQSRCMASRAEPRAHGASAPRPAFRRRAFAR